MKPQETSSPDNITNIFCVEEFKSYFFTLYIIGSNSKELNFLTFFGFFKSLFLSLSLALTHTIHKHFLLPLSLIRSLSIYRKCFPVYSYLFAGLKCTRLLSNTLLTKFCKSFNMWLTYQERQFLL